MAIALDRQSNLLPAVPTPTIEKASLKSSAISESSPVSTGEAGSSFDVVFLWACITCGLLLAGMHVYELVTWMLG
jgi:hypothetical protein